MQPRAGRAGGNRAPGRKVTAILKVEADALSMQLKDPC